MCGIVGLFAKSAEIEDGLGSHLAAMLEQMSDRGPDGAGVAVYRDPAPSGSSKLTLFPPTTSGLGRARRRARERLRRRAGARCGRATPSFVVAADAPESEAWARSVHPELRVMSAGRTIEIYGGQPPGGVRVRVLTR